MKIMARRLVEAYCDRCQVRDEHDLAGYASFAQQLVRKPCLSQRKSLRDERLNLLLLQEAEQGGQILPE